MYPRVELDGGVIELKDTLAQGGEAVVYRLKGEQFCFKLYKDENHPDFAGKPVAQSLVKEKLTEHQTKLPALERLASSFPNNVVMPTSLGYQPGAKKIIGFKMPLIKDGIRLFDICDRNSLLYGYDMNRRFQILKKLFETTDAAHKQGGVFGDFNDMGVMISGETPYILDADAMQITLNGKHYLCKVYKDLFVDPLLCDPKGKFPIMVQGQIYSTDSDWYSAQVMLFRSLMFIGPYDGTFKPKDPKRYCKDGRRPLLSVSVFDPEVEYPDDDVATPLKCFPDSLLDRLTQTFQKQVRGQFPLAVLEGMRWTNCTKCGKGHARNSCPFCSNPAPVAVKQKVVQRGTVTSTQVFVTSESIINASLVNGQLIIFTLENGNVKRQDNGLTLAIPLDITSRVRPHGPNTVVGSKGKMMTISQTGSVISGPHDVDVIDNKTMFDTNSTNRFWSSQGSLWTEGKYGPEIIGSVFQGKTKFWVGEKFGFGYFQDGPIYSAFTFNSIVGSLSDGVKIKPLPNKIRDSHAVFSDQTCWFFLTHQTNGPTEIICQVIHKSGQVLATLNSDVDNEEVLKHFKTSVAFDQFDKQSGEQKHFLLVATNKGVVRLEQTGTVISVTKEYPDTASFVNSKTKLLLDSGGLLAIKQRDINRIVIR